MQRNIFYLDQYIEVMADRVNVIYDSRTDSYEVAEIEGANLRAERSEDWLTMLLLCVGFNGVVFLIATLSIFQHGTWQWLLFPALLISLPINEQLRKNMRKWILILETIHGPATILTSTDGICLSKVKRAINEAIQARDKTLMRA